MPDGFFFVRNEDSATREAALIDYGVPVLIPGLEKEPIAVFPHGDGQSVPRQHGLGESAIHRAKLGGIASTQSMEQGPSGEPVGT